MDEVGGDDERKVYDPDQLDKVDLTSLVLGSEDVLVSLCDEAGYKSVVFDYYMRKGNLRAARNLLFDLSGVPVEKVVDIFNGLRRKYVGIQKKSGREYSKLQTDEERNAFDVFRRDEMDYGRRIQELDVEARTHGLKRKGKKYIPFSTETQ